MVSNLLEKLKSTGFFNIVGAGFINKALSLLMSILLVRMLSKADYGAYAYAFNIASFFIMLNGMGAASAVLQICSELYRDAEGSNSVYAYGYRAGVIVDVIMCGCIALVAYYVPLAVEGSDAILLMYCTYPLLLFICEIELTYHRVHLENKEYALLTNLQTVLNVAFSIVGAYLLQAQGLVIGQCIAAAVAWVVMVVRNPQKRMLLDKIVLSKAKKRDWWKVAFISALNNALGHALTLIGTFFVGLLLVDPTLVAEYHVATTIPFALLFFPGLIITYVYPHFARNKDDRDWTVRNYRRLVVASVAVMGLLAIILFVIAEPLFGLIFGSQYLASVPAFRLLLLGFFITSSFRQITGNLLVTQRKLWFNTLIGITSIGFNVVASIILIPKFGIMGAAAVYDATMLLGASMSVPYYLYVLSRIGRQE